MKRLVEATMQRAVLMIVCVAAILAWEGIINDLIDQSSNS